MDRKKFIGLFSVLFLSTIAFMPFFKGDIISAQSYPVSNPSPIIFDDIVEDEDFVDIVDFEGEIINIDYTNQRLTLRNGTEVRDLRVTVDSDLGGTSLNDLRVGQEVFVRYDRFTNNIESLEVQDSVAITDTGWLAIGLGLALIAILLLLYFLSKRKSSFVKVKNP